MRIVLNTIIIMFGMVINAQTILRIEGQTYVNSDSGTWIGVSPPRSKPTRSIFKNNSITSINTAGYQLQAGEDWIGEWKNNLEGARITGNNLNLNGSVTTFAQWQALGFDSQSEIVNHDSIDKTNFIPEESLYYSTNIGSKWAYGHSTKASWIKTDPDSTIQNGLWQVGEIIYGEIKQKSKAINNEVHTYYVATNGNDTNPGSIDLPFGTWQKGFDVAVAGDIVYIRGGTYYPDGIKGEGGVYCGVYVNGKNGTFNDQIKIWASPGEIPVLDCRNLTQNGTRIGIYLYNVDYWHLKGLYVTRVDQASDTFGSNGIRIYSGNYNKLEQIRSYANGGSGIAIVYESEGNYILNCDTYYNYDKYTFGGNADGIEIADIFERNGNERVNTVKGCRAWDNSDDGFDHYKCEGILTIDSCWVWNNGVIPGTDTPAGDGNGFKLGVTFGMPESVVQRNLTNCIACNHRQNGFSQQSAHVKMIFYNNTSFNNGGYGYEFVDYNMADVLKNNISFKDGTAAPKKSNQKSDHNSWQGGLKVTRNDFVSLDDTQLLRSRKTNGNLPDITFLHLVNESDLIDAGEDVGLRFNGKAPDIGAFETQPGESGSRSLDIFMWLKILFISFPTL